jgi:hypothetical protein
MRRCEQRLDSFDKASRKDDAWLKPSAFAVAML